MKPYPAPGLPLKIKRRIVLPSSIKVMMSCVFILTAFVANLVAQPLVKGYGNLEGIRIEGQLMEFESSLRVVAPDWKSELKTAKEQQRPDYKREGNQQIVTSKLGTVRLKEVVEPMGRGEARVRVSFTAESDTNIAGAYFAVQLPADQYAGGTAELVNPASGAPKQVTLSAGQMNDGAYLRAKASGIAFKSPKRRLKVTFVEPLEVVVRNSMEEGNNDFVAYFPVIKGNTTKGQKATQTFLLKADGEIDHRPVSFRLDTSRPGRAFKGMGGNFRLQNPEMDPKVIDYNLDNMRVAMGRVRAPLNFWQPDEDMNPIRAAHRGDLHPIVKADMEMAQRLARRDIPVVLSAWSAPEWAIIGKPHRGPGPDGERGNPLDQDKAQALYKSIADYIEYMKDAYGVQVEYFSFNESDLGIDVRQTADEHAKLIRELGAYFAKRGLKTKLLLGDTADANGWPFLKAAMNDPKTHPYIGAVSFHSWRGWDTETLQKWYDAAYRMHVPLIVGEGSTDAAAWGFPDIFSEQSFAMTEIKLYTRILSICQPQTILQWQLTSDYSVLAGGGVYGNDEEPLHPTQRFWNLKQIASSPKDALWMPFSGDRPDIYSAAFGDKTKGKYVFHIVNDGASRKATITGLPDGIDTLHKFVTDHQRGMKDVGAIPVKDGEAEVTLDPVSFISFYSYDAR